MSSRPLQPQVERRHRLRRVLVDQRGQRVDVVGLERLDVARRAARGRPRRAAPSASPALASLASSVARARCSALLTEATLVSSSSATSVAFQRSTSQRISTARWRGGRCCSAATNASRIVSRATATSAGSPSSDDEAVGDRLDPGHLGRHVQVPSIGSRAGPEIHRPRAALAAVEHVEADVRRDPVQPRAQGRAALEAVERAPGADQRLLHRVLGLERRAEHAVAVGGQLAAMLLELGLELAGRGPIVSDGSSMTLILRTPAGEPERSGLSALFSRRACCRSRAASSGRSGRRATRHRCPARRR